MCTHAVIVTMGYMEPMECHPKIDVWTSPWQETFEQNFYNVCLRNYMYMGFEGTYLNIPPGMLGWSL